MFKKLKSLRIQYIYHFTDSANIGLIKKYNGLLSYRKIKELGLDGIKYGGNKWSHEADERKGFDGYVHLCFRKNHPMLYVAEKEKRIKIPKWLEIKIDILKKEGILYTNDVSNKAGVSPMDNAAALKDLDFEAIYRHIPFKIEGNFERKCQAEKYEILIPDHIPLEYIEGFNG